MNNTVVELRNQRKSATVLKTELAVLRDREPASPVIVIEGKGDVSVFEVWINRSSYEFEWTPIVAEGKGNLLKFRRMLSRDVTGLSKRIYFIVDCDYDGLRGQPEDENIYVLPAHSIENILVSKETLDRLVRSSLLLPGGAFTRAPIVDAFMHRRTETMELLLPICGTMLAAARLGDNNIQVDENLNKYLSVSVDSVIPRPGSQLGSIIKLSGEVSLEQINESIVELRNKGLENWIRGKFLYSFFRRYCASVEQDIKHPSPRLLPAPHNASFKPNDFELTRLASLSPIPRGLPEAISRWRLA